MQRNGGYGGGHPPTPESVLCSRCLCSGEARCRRTVCLKVGQVSMVVPQNGQCLRACAHIRPMHMQAAGATCRSALLSLNYARRASTDSDAFPPRANLTPAHVLPSPFPGHSTSRDFDLVTGFRGFRPGRVDAAERVSAFAKDLESGYM